MLWPALGNSITPCQNLVSRARSAKGLFKFHKYIYSKNWLRLLDQDKAVTVASRSSWLWPSGGKVLFLSLPPASKHHHPSLVFPHPLMPAVWQKGHGTNQLNCWFINQILATQFTQNSTVCSSWLCLWRQWFCSCNKLLLIRGFSVKVLSRVRWTTLMKKQLSVRVSGWAFSFRKAISCENKFPFQKCSSYFHFLAEKGIISTCPCDHNICEELQSKGWCPLFFLRWSTSPMRTCTRSS